MTLHVPTASPLHRRLVGAGLTGLTAATVLIGTAPTADAHVTLTPSTTSAGAYTVLTFSVGHGCDGSATTAITVRMPDQILAVTPTINPAWTVRKTMQALAEPVDNGHGGTYTERVDTVVYRATTPLPDGYRDTFQLQLQLPAEEGERLIFPVLQTCEKGENAWVQTVADGQEEPEYPAPTLQVTEATADTHGHDAASDDEALETAGPGSGSEMPTWLGWTALALGAGGLGAGATALGRSRR